MNSAITFAQDAVASAAAGANTVTGATYFVAANGSANTTETVGLIGMAGIAIAAVLLLALFVGALVSISRSTNYNTGGKALWVLVCFAFPLVGPLVWFGFGKNSTM